MDLKAQIQNINDLTDNKTFQALREKVWMLNCNDPENKEIIQLARDKGLI